MGIIDDIHREKASIQTAVFRSALGKKITNEILIPILEQVEQSVPDILELAGMWARDRIISYLQSITPSGRRYEIWTYDPSQPYGYRTEYEMEYQASAEGQPPAQLTGTLAESIEYEIYSDGTMEIGLLKTKGQFSNDMTEFGSVFFRGGKIFVGVNDGDNSYTPVGTYARILENELRPWFNEFFNSIRQDFRNVIRDQLKDSLRQATRRTSVRRAVVYKVIFE